jgi:predicted kinase
MIDHKQLTYIQLIGLPGSGKSYFKEQYNNFGKFKIISTDDYIDKEASIQGKTYNEIFQNHIKFATRAMEQDFEYACFEKKNMIHDQTNLTKSKRMKFLSALPKNYSKIGILFEVDDELRKFRMSQRPGKIIDEKIIDQMKRLYEPPAMDEGFDIITKLDQAWKLFI